MIPVLDLPESLSEIQQQGWEQLSSGASRSTFVHPDWPRVVLKYERWDQGDDNQQECDIWEAFGETSLGFTFTPVLARSENYISVIMKEALCFHWKTIADDEQMGRRTYTLHDRPALEGWREVTRLSGRAGDLHSENYGWIMDDYGDLVPGPLVDYAGCA